MPLDFLQNNILSLAKYNYVVIPKLDQMDFSEINGLEEEKAQNGLSTLFFHKDGTRFLLHSQYDPQAEAERMIKNLEYTNDSLIVVFGLGLGYHLFALQKKISRDTRVIVVEHNTDIFKYALQNVDLSPLFDCGQFRFVFGDRQQIAELMLSQAGSNLYNLALNIQFISLPNYYLYASENLWAMNRIAQRLSAAIISFGNDLGDIFTGMCNSYLNVDACMKTNSIREVQHKYQNVPAIIVASGPSLDKNIHYLKEAYGKALIIACDASMEACGRQGVKPDAVASIERDEPTYDYYYKDKIYPEDVVLVGPQLLWPNIYAEYPGKTIIMCKHFEGPEFWWTSKFNNIEFVNQGHSSATAAFAVARQAGCNPIILIGQDLAYSEGKKHSALTHTEQEEPNDDREFDGTYLEDHEGNLLRSDCIYKIFKEWYENYIAAFPDVKVIDATEGGAYIHGSELMTFKEAIGTYCTVPLEKHMVEYLGDIVVTEKEKLEKYAVIIESVFAEMKKLRNIKKKSERHYKRLLAIEKKFDFNKCNDAELERILIKMEQGDEIVQQILNSEHSIKQYYRQIIVQTIIYVKQLGNTLTSENLKKNHLFQKNLMYILNNSTDLILKEYENAKDFLEKKKAELETAIK